jgi:hypothetical protein
MLTKSSDTADNRGGSTGNGPPAIRRGHDPAKALNGPTAAETRSRPRGPGHRRTGLRPGSPCIA